MKKLICLLAIIILSGTVMTAQNATSGYSYYMKGDYAQSLEAYSAAIQLNPEYAPSFFGRALANANLNKLNEAVQDFTTCLKLDPKNHQALYARAIVYTKLGDNSKAMSDINEAIALSKDNSNYYYERANLHYYMENDEKSIEDYTKALELSPTNGVAYYGRGIAYKFAGKLKEAERDLQTYITMNGNKENLQAEAERLIKILKDDISN